MLVSAMWIKLAHLVTKTSEHCCKTIGQRCYQLSFTSHGQVQICRSSHVVSHSLREGAPLLESTTSPALERSVAWTRVRDRAFFPRRTAWNSFGRLSFHALCHLLIGILCRWKATSSDIIILSPLICYSTDGSFRFNRNSLMTVALSNSRRSGSLRRPSKQCPRKY